MNIFLKYNLRKSKKNIAKRINKNLIKEISLDYLL